ncbi:sporulation protein SpoOM [Peribacillus saganii]|uniref:Sporulation protein SpoOM n=1 Tax=Peribacillus saganii TaxID=2303992 RepID=A0A372LL50_9BACI|nr:sporulation protein [Peribacillus saganii]RFU66438.1 sporulation protein SpoOM [Peribacillus saganii]
MTLFNKMLASVGIGSAKVDTRLEKDRFYPGDYVKGVVEVQGGNIAQKIEEIHLKLATTYIREHDDKKIKQTAVFETFRLTAPFEVAPNMKKEIPFQLRLPLDTPLTYGKTKVWISTGLDIKNAVDPTDEDFIHVQPDALLHSVLLSLTELGFKLKNADCEEAPHRLRRRYPFVQEFEFVPVSGPYRGRLDELELVFFRESENEVQVLLEVDRKARGLAGLFAQALEMDETKVRTVLSTSDISNMKNKLDSIIRAHA